MWLSACGSGGLALQRPVRKSSRSTVAVLRPAGVKPPTTYAASPTTPAETSVRDEGDGGNRTQRSARSPVAPAAAAPAAVATAIRTRACRNIGRRLTPGDAQLVVTVCVPE